MVTFHMKDNLSDDGTSKIDVRTIIRAKRVSNCYMQEKKNWPAVCVDVCVDVRLILVLVLGRQIVYGQNTVYLCLSKYIPVVFENTQQ